MRKIVLVTLLSFFSFYSTAQQRGVDVDEKDYPYRYFECNLMSGQILFQNFAVPFPNDKPYLNVLNSYIGKIEFTTSSSNGISIQKGYFFNHDRNIGFGFGILFSMVTGNIKMDSFHVEYQSTDYQNRIFRQLVTSNAPITETINYYDLSIPLLFKINKELDRKDRFVFNMDCGAIISFPVTVAYNSKASFDYEAIYHYVNGNTEKAVYDNSPIPSINDVYYTKVQYQKSNPNGMVQSFKDLAAQGYNVGLGIKTAQKGNVAFNNITLGFILQPQISYRISTKNRIMLGAYIIYQPYSNASTNNTHLTDKVGQYSSLLNSVSQVQDCYYGISIGLRHYFGKYNYEEQAIRNNTYLDPRDF